MKSVTYFHGVAKIKKRLKMGDLQKYRDVGRRNNLTLNR